MASTFTGDDGHTWVVAEKSPWAGYTNVVRVFDGAQSVRVTSQLLTAGITPQLDVEQDDGYDDGHDDT